MTSTFAAQLRTIAANSTNELDLRARRDTHAESLIFERSVAVKQDWETLYQICVEGFQELCLLDSRLREFEKNLYSPQAKDQDREQLSKTQNEALGLVIERCLALLGSKILLRPGVRAMEWLVRRFRVHIYNTGAVLATLLPYHELPVFRNVLSVIPANKIPAEWKFLGPYHKTAANVPRHAVVYSATNNDAFFSYFNNYTLRAFQEGSSYSHLVRFWASLLIESITARLNQLKSGRKEVQRQRLEDALLKIFPLLVEGFEIKHCLEVTVTCFTVALVLASNADLEDSVIDSLIQAVASHLTDSESDPKSALACLIMLVAKKADPRIPKIALESFMRIPDLESRLLELSGQLPVDPFCEALIHSSLKGLKRSNLDSRFAFIERLLNMNLEAFQPSTPSRFVAILIRRLQPAVTADSFDSVVERKLVHLLQKLNDSATFSQTFSQAVLLAGQSLDEVETIIEGTVERTNGLDLIAPSHMDGAGENGNKSLDSDILKSKLAALPSESAESTFLASKQSALFAQLLQIFALCHKSEAQLARFEALPIWGQRQEAPSDLRTSFLLRTAHTALPVSQQATALKSLAKTFEKESGHNVQLSIPYLTVLLADTAQPVRRAAVACLLALRQGPTQDVEREGDQQNAIETVHDGIVMAYVKRIPITQAVKILDQVYLPQLEECVLDASHIGKVLESAFDSTSRSVSMGSKTASVELKKSLKHDLFELLTSCAIGSQLIKVQIGIVQLLEKVHKVGTSTTSKTLLPILKDWMSLSEADATSAAVSEGLSLSQVDSVLVRLIDLHGKEAVEQTLTVLSKEHSSLRSGLMASFFDRLTSDWKEMRHENQISTAVLLFDMVFSDNASLARGSRGVLHSVTLPTDALAALLDHACSGLAQMPTDLPPKKRRRISHGRESIPNEIITGLDIADSRLTFALEVVENSRPQNHPQLLGTLFEVLITLRRLRDKSTSESPYLVTLCLSSILAIIDKARESRKPAIDLSSIRADLVTDHVRSSNNPQVQATALLLAASLASLAPDRILHTIMPIFTFMGQSILSRDDERSIYVTNQAIDQIIPPLVSTLKKQDATNLVHSTSSLLSSFVAAYDHIPQHRRTAFYQRLLSRLGADDFAFAIIALLASRRRNQDMVPFFSSLVGDLPAMTQLSIQRKMLHLVTDVLSDNPHDAEPLLDITRSTESQQREREALILLETASKLVESKGLKIQIKRLHQMTDAEIESFWAQYRDCLAQLLFMLKEQKSRHSALTASTRKCLSAILEIASLAELLHVMPTLLQEMEQIGDQELQPLALRALATQLRHNAAKDTRTQAEAVSFLPTIETILRATEDEALRHAAISCLDRIVEVYGRKSPDSIISACSVLIEDDHGMSSPDSRTQIMSLLCLTSIVEVLKEEAVPVVPQSMPKVLGLLKMSMSADTRNDELHHVAYTLLSSFISHVSFMISDENLTEILELCYSSCVARMDASCKESRIEALTLIANKADLSTVTTSLNQAWKVVPANIDVEAVTEYLDLLSQATERNSKSTVMRSADELSALILQTLDLRRISLLPSQHEGISEEGVDAIESKAQTLSIIFIYKLNDTAFRPLFENWVDWAIQGSDLADVEYSDEFKTARETSLFNFVSHFFATLKSIVTSYASYILEPANEVLQSTGESVDAIVSDQRVTLYKSTINLVTTALSHDADGFFASPSHFSLLSANLVSQLTLAYAKSKSLRATIPALVIPALVALATATMDTPAHHHAINHGLCQLRHNSSAAVRLSAIRTQLALTQSEEVGEEWVNDVVVGTSTEGVGGSGETMVYVNESLEDDDEEVEKEVRRWVRLVREMVGEDVFEM